MAVFLVIKEKLYHLMSLLFEEGIAANTDYSQQLEFMTTLVSMVLLTLLSEILLIVSSP